MAWAAGPVRGVARVGAFSRSGRRREPGQLHRSASQLAIPWTWLRSSASQPCGLPARHRERLFPDVPLLIAGVEERRLLPEFLGPKTATVGDRYDPTLIIEDILQVLPGTRQIVIVFGVSPLERFWSAECRRAFARFENRVQFRWLEGLSFEAMKREVASLPRTPWSFMVCCSETPTGCRSRRTTL